MSELRRFLFDGMPVRGLLVRLTDDWREVLRRRGASGAQPAPVRALVGQMAAAGVLMQASIRFNGALVLQLVGDGPVKLAVAEVGNDLSFRATATVQGEVPEDARLEALLNLHGQGRCAITLDPADKRAGQRPYQGVVPLHGDRREPLQQLSQVLEHYMLQSEQLDTRLVLAADDEVAAGLLIQRMPAEGQGYLGASRVAREARIGIDEDFNRVTLLAATLTADELLTLDAETLLHRLFWEEPLRRLEHHPGERPPRFECRCSRERVGRMLQGLGADEVNGIVAEQQRVEVGCEFCGLKYHFDAVDVGAMFTPDEARVQGSSAVN